MEVLIAYYVGYTITILALILVGWSLLRCLWWCLRASVVMGIRWARRASSPIE